MEKTYYDKKDLKARGWTDSMIRDLIGDAELNNAPGSNRRGKLGYYYYDIKKVEAIEKTEEFKERKQKRIPR